MPPMMKCMWCTFSVTTILSIRCHPWWNVCDVSDNLVHKMPPMMKCMWCKCTFSVTTILSIRCHPWWNVCDVNVRLVLSCPSDATHWNVCDVNARLVLQQSCSSLSVTTILSIRCHHWWNVCDVNARLVLWQSCPSDATHDEMYVM